MPGTVTPRGALHRDNPRWSAEKTICGRYWVGSLISGTSTSPEMICC